MSSDAVQPQCPSLHAALAERVIIADGAMGVMPDVVRNVHEGYLAAGSDRIFANLFSANLGRPSPDGAKVLRHPEAKYFGT